MRHKPEVVRDVQKFSDHCHQTRLSGGTVALVPTMGALHEGHLTLVDEASRHGSLVAVSIFVNPTQFGPGEDLDRYPRDLEGDLAKLASRGAHAVFAPGAQSMYPTGASTSVVVEGVSAGLCGAHRPGHFAGVATIVSKLFNITGPCTAVFGRKDYQQLQVIKRMVTDLNMPITVIGAPTIREADGLAMSSRNAYLTEEQRSRALAIPAGLSDAHRLFATGERRVSILRDAVESSVGAAVDSVDYITATDPDTLATMRDEQTCGARLLIAIAARVGATRLIDNTVLGEDRAPVTDEANE